MLVPLKVKYIGDKISGTSSQPVLPQVPLKALRYDLYPEQINFIG